MRDCPALSLIPALRADINFLSCPMSLRTYCQEHEKQTAGGQRPELTWRMLPSLTYHVCCNRYDGALGIIVPIAAAKAVAARAAVERCTPADERVGKCSVEDGHALFERPFEIIAFADEEGVRCGADWLDPVAH